MTSNIETVSYYIPQAIDPSDNDNEINIQLQNPFVTKVKVKYICSAATNNILEVSSSLLPVFHFASILGGYAHDLEYSINRNINGIHHFWLNRVDTFPVAPYVGMLVIILEFHH